MNHTILAYSLYLPITVATTIWVARTLHKNGRIFLVDTFHGNAELADSVNHLLLVGFYLVNLGFVALFLKLGITLDTLSQVFEELSAKVGTVLLVLGAMHFFNIFLFNKMRKRARLQHEPPPVPPNAHA